ncbi:MAG: hypothetical protein RLZZ289_1724, partial [Bacteroidota bacterium]
MKKLLFFFFVSLALTATAQQYKIAEG